MKVSFAVYSVAADLAVAQVHNSLTSKFRSARPTTSL
jgi:hypothetical protein